MGVSLVRFGNRPGDPTKDGKYMCDVDDAKADPLANCEPRRCGAPEPPKPVIPAENEEMIPDIPHPRANERVGIPPRRTGGSFVSVLINGRNSFGITQA